MILWGPPGTGKTTLARLLAAGSDMHLIALSAVLAGVKDVREAVQVAALGCLSIRSAPETFQPVGFLSNFILQWFCKRRLDGGLC